MDGMEEWDDGWVATKKNETREAEMKEWNIHKK